MWKHQKNHNVCRYTHGTYCEDCGEFFEMGSDEYLRCDGIFALFLACHNLAIDNGRLRGARGLAHTLGSLDSWNSPIEVLRDWEGKALKYLRKHGRNEKSAVVELDSPSRVIFSS